MTQDPHNPLEGDIPEMSIDLHDGTDEQISIIIVHRNRPEYLNVLCQSISMCSFNNNYEIVIVDNNSDAESQEYLKDIEGEVKIVRNDKNLYWSAAANKGADAASKSSKYFVFLHCDCVILNPGWLDLLVSVAQSQGSSLVGCDQSSYVLQKQKIDFIQEWCMLVTRECYDAVGGWAETLPLVGHAFIFSFKAQRAGYKPQVMKNTIVHHYRIFALEDVNVWEKMLESASKNIPELLRDMQTEQLKSNV